MNPNDRPGTPFSEQPLPGPKKMHVCRDGRCVVTYSGGALTPESRKAVEDFLDRHKPKEK